jgi:protein SCO1/2
VRDLFIFMGENKFMNSEKSQCLLRVAGVFGFILLLIASVGCNHVKKYPLQGTVVAKNAATNEITLKHGDIPGFMSAMTMPYLVKDPAVVQELQPGDKIAAEVIVGKNESDYWLEGVRITDESARGPAQPPAALHMLTPGEQVPDLALINQDGRTIHLSDFAGRALLVTFIYTRCPMPNFCPRLSSQFARIHDALKKNSEDYNKTHLLTVSFDPKYDTPSVLRKYGLAYLDGDESGFFHWDFASTNPVDLARVAQAFGLQYEEKDNQITHNMSIVLIAPDGTVAKFWTTEWTWTELMESMQHAVQGAAQRRGK